MNFWKYALLGMVLIISNSTNAALIDNGIYTTDTASGLDWLDLTETTNISYNQMLAQINNPSSMYSNFRYATLAELDQLIQPFNLTTGNMVNSGFSTDIANLSDYLGITMFESPPGTAGFIGTGFYGFLGDLTSENFRGIIGMYNSTICQTGDCYAVQTQFASPDLTSEIYGHFLVKDTAVVPVPAAVWLFGSGLIGLIGIARRRILD